MRAVGSYLLHFGLVVFCPRLLMTKNDLHVRTAEQAVAGNNFAVILFGDLALLLIRHLVPDVAYLHVDRGRIPDRVCYRGYGTVIFYHDVQMIVGLAGGNFDKPVQYLQALSSTLPITSTKSFCSPTKLISGEISRLMFTPLR